MWGVNHMFVGDELFFKSNDIKSLSEARLLIRRRYRVSWCVGTFMCKWQENESKG